jgi:hypothetical protein
MTQPPSEGSIFGIPISKEASRGMNILCLVLFGGLGIPVSIYSIATSKQERYIEVYDDRVVIPFLLRPRNPIEIFFAETATIEPSPMFPKPNVNFRSTQGKQRMITQDMFLNQDEFPTFATLLRQQLEKSKLPPMTL